MLVPFPGSTRTPLSLPFRAHALAALAAACPGAATPGHLLGPDRAEEVVACVADRERATRDRPPLTPDPRLTRAARRHAADMVERGYFAHTSPGGASPLDRLRRAGYATRPPFRYGEVLATGTRHGATPAALVRAWLRSPPHRRILLDPRLRELGVGVATGTPDGPSRPGITVAADLGGP